MTFLGATDGNYRNLGTTGKSWPCKAHFFVCFRSDVGDARGMISEQPWFVHNDLDTARCGSTKTRELLLLNFGSPVTDLLYSNLKSLVTDGIIDTPDSPE